MGASRGTLGWNSPPGWIESTLRLADILSFVLESGAGKRRREYWDDRTRIFDREEEFILMRDVLVEVGGAIVGYNVHVPSNPRGTSGSSCS